MTLGIKKAIWVLPGIATFVLAANVAVRFTTDRHIANARKIRIGDSQRRVTELLGEPKGRHTGWFGSSPSWSYGSSFDFEAGFPWLRFQFSGPSTNQIAFFFDGSSNVARIQIPNW